MIAILTPPLNILDSQRSVNACVLQTGLSMIAYPLHTKKLKCGTSSQHALHIAEKKCYKQTFSRRFARVTRDNK